MKVKCVIKDELGLDPSEVWTSELPELPRVGDFVKSAKEWTELIIDYDKLPKGDVLGVLAPDNIPKKEVKRSIELVVSKITWVKEFISGIQTKWIPEITLAIPLYYLDLENFKAVYARLIKHDKEQEKEK